MTAEEEEKGCLQRVGSSVPCPQKAPLSWRRPGPSQLAPLLARDAASPVPTATPTPFRALLHVPPGGTRDQAGRPGSRDRRPPAGSPGGPRWWDSPTGSSTRASHISQVPPFPQPRRCAPSRKDGSCSNHTERCTWTRDTGNIRETKGPDTESKTHREKDHSGHRERRDNHKTGEDTGTSTRCQEPPRREDSRLRLCAVSSPSGGSLGGVLWAEQGGAQAGRAEPKPPDLTPSPTPVHTTLPQASTSTATLERTVPSSAEMAPGG